MEKFNAKIIITLHEGILDVQGKAVENALRSIGFSEMSNVRIGKHVELSIESETKEKAFEQVRDACEKLIANPIIEDYKIEIH